jgi:hypothetical protein
LYDLEREKERNVFTLGKLQSDRESLEQRIYRLNVHSLTLAAALLYHIRVEKRDNNTFPVIEGLITKQVFFALNLVNSYL